MCKIKKFFSSFAGLASVKNNENGADAGPFVKGMDEGDLDKLLTADIARYKGLVFSIEAFGTDDTDRISEAELTDCVCAALGVTAEELAASNAKPPLCRFGPGGEFERDYTPDIQQGVSKSLLNPDRSAGVRKFISFLQRCLKELLSALSAPNRQGLGSDGSIVMLPHNKALRESDSHGYH